MIRATEDSRPARTPSERLAGTLAVALVIVYVLAVGVIIWLDVLLHVRTGDRPAPVGLVFLLLITLPVLGAVIVLRRPRHIVGWLLLTAALLLAAGGSGGSLIAYQVEVVGEPSAVATVGAWLSSWVWFTFVMLGLALVPLLFPDGRPPSRRWRPAVWAAAGVATLVFIYQALAERIVVTGPAPDGAGRQAIYDVANPIGIPGLPLTGPVEAVAGGVVGAVTLAVFLAAWLAPIVRFRRGTGLERQQVKWLALVVGALPVVLLAVLLAHTVLDAPTNIASIAFYTWAAAVPVAIGVAILRHGLYEIDRIISRTVSYGLVVAVLGAVYAAGVVGLGTAVSAVTGQEDNDLVAAASVLAVVALFRPVRSRAQQAVDRRFNRTGYEAGLAVDAFAQQLRDDVDLATIRRDIAQTAASALEPTHISLWLVADPDGSTSASPPPSRRP